jgi:hypothetical protein
MKQRKSKKSCYLCTELDPNEEHYSSRKHCICLICGVKLYELAESDLSFDMREKIVRVCFADIGETGIWGKPVVLSTGYEVELADPDGLEHLFNAIIGEVIHRFKDTDEFAKQGWALIHNICICELHYVAGQLRARGSGIDIDKLMDEFNVQWDRIAGDFNGPDTPKEE